RPPHPPQCPSWHATDSGKRRNASRRLREAKHIPLRYCPPTTDLFPRLPQAGRVPCLTDGDKQRGRSTASDRDPHRRRTSRQPMRSRNRATLRAPSRTESQKNRTGPAENRAVTVRISTRVSERH